MKGSHSPIVYAAAAIAGIGGLLFGYDTGVISGAILFITPAFHLSTTLEEAVVSTVLGGAVVGAIFGGGLGDRWGRRKTITYAEATLGRRPLPLTSGLTGMALRLALLDPTFYAPHIFGAGKTKSKTLEQIERHWQVGKHPRAL